LVALAQIPLRFGAAELSAFAEPLRSLGGILLNPLASHIQLRQVIDRFWMVLVGCLAIPFRSRCTIGLYSTRDVLAA
jgi:hypothetical protein